MPPSHPRHKPAKAARPTTPHHQPSRTSTPSAISAESGPLSAPLASPGSYITVNLEAGRPLSDSAVSDVLETNKAATAIPTSGTLRDIYSGIKGGLVEKILIRSEACDRLVRELARRRKERIERNREKERAKRVKQEAGERSKKKLTRKRHRDGDSPDSTSKASETHDKDDRTENGEDEEDDDEEEYGEGEATVPQFTFGPNPLKFPDPTIYRIRDVGEEMPMELKKEIYSVARYPALDLAYLAPGEPPDKDYTITKPASQTTAQAFANYVEPFLRPLTEEDLNFLRDRGDRLTPFVIPSRGKQHYKDTWAEEDGAMSVDSDNEQYLPNEARGDADLIDDEVAETDQVSLGPVFSRLMMALLPDTSNPTGSDSDSGVHTEGADYENNPQANGAQTAPYPPACAIPDDSDQFHSFGSSRPRPQAAPPVPPLPFEKMEDRVLAELRHIGFLDDTTPKPEYDSHYDDEVAARLRMLQEELRLQSLINGARKARLLEIAELHMAMQEYNNISEDLDTQLNSAYTKRSRVIGKGKKNVKRGPAASMGVPTAAPSAPAIGESIKALMERRRQWKEVIGPVFGPTKPELPKESIFDKANMTRLLERDNAHWVNGGEEDDQEDEGIAA